jgi:hypothetical protein
MGRMRSKEIFSMLKKSKIVEISNKPMTAKEINLDNKLTNYLKSRSIIKEKENIRQGGHWATVWGPGIYYDKYMKLWGIKSKEKSKNFGKRFPG